MWVFEPQDFFVNAINAMNNLPCGSSSVLLLVGLSLAASWMSNSFRTLSFLVSMFSKMF